MENEPVSQAIMVVREVEPYKFDIQIEGSDLSLEVSQIMVKFLNDCLEQIQYSLEYSSWVAMKDRCLNQKSKDYAKYGGKGITIYKEWIDSFEKFYEHIGKKQKGQSIDRIDNTKGYEPGNVRWANNSQQQRNKQNSLWLLWNNKKTHIMDIAKDLGISKGAAHLRWKRGKLHGAKAITENC